MTHMKTRQFAHVTQVTTNYSPLVYIQAQSLATDRRQTTEYILILIVHSIKDGFIFVLHNTYIES